MSEYLVKGETLTEIADAVRAKTGKTANLTTAQMASELNSITERTSADLTASGATVTVPAGNYKSQATKSVATATQATPGINVDANGLITATATQTAGYVAAGTKSATQQLQVQGDKVVTPARIVQTAVYPGYYTTGTVKVAGDDNLKAENIAKGVSIFGVEGTKTSDLEVPFTYTVEPVDTYEYGFVLQKDGYYESQIAYIDGAVSAICRINLYVYQTSDIVFDVSYGGVGCYTNFSRLDVASFLDYPTYTSSCQQMFSPSTSGGVRTGSVTYSGVSVGTHFVYVYVYKSTTTPGNMYSRFKIASHELSEELNKKISSLDSDLSANNIRYGVNIFGVDGEYTGNTDNEDALVVRDEYTSLAYVNNRVSKIGSNAFYRYYGLYTVSCQSATAIGASAFYYCNSLRTTNFPAATTISDYAFAYCVYLSSINFPVASYISLYAFANCYRLPAASFPAATVISDYAFASCSSLATANFPAAKIIGGSAFTSCSRLVDVSFPAASNIGNRAFYYCKSLTSADFPSVSSVGSYAFYGCYSLATANFPAASVIGSSVFNGCYNLKSLYLLGSSVCTLSHSNAFSSTPIGGYSASAGTYGSIYVPASLFTSYRTATNWTYFSNRLVSYADIM